MGKYNWSKNERRERSDLFHVGCMYSAALMAFKQGCWSDLCSMRSSRHLLFSTVLTHLQYFSILFFSPAVLDQLPFMMMSHPLIPASLAPASVSMAMGQMNRLSTLASIANVAQLHANPPARAPTSVIKVNSDARQPGGSDRQPESVTHGNYD